MDAACEKWSLLLDEFKYRHELFHKLYFRFLYAELFLFASGLFYGLLVGQEIAESTRALLFAAFAVTLLVLSLAGFYLLVSEYTRLRILDESLVQLQKGLGATFLPREGELDGLGRFERSLFGGAIKAVATNPKKIYLLSCASLVLIALLFCGMLSASFRVTQSDSAPSVRVLDGGTLKNEAQGKLD